MSTIAACIKDNVVSMGSDSCVVDGDRYVINEDPKIFEENNFMVGVTGSTRLKNILEVEKYPPVSLAQGDPVSYVKNYMIPVIDRAMRNSSYKLPEHEKPVEGAVISGPIIVALEKGIVQINEDLSIVGAFPHFWAIGGGEAVCLGALHVIYPVAEPPVAIDIALDVASQYHLYTKPPYHIATMEFTCQQKEQN